MKILNIFRSKPADFRLLLSSANGRLDLYSDNSGRYFITDHRIEPIYFSRNRDRAFSRFISLASNRLQEN